MADTSVELRAPLPDGASKATLTWITKGAKPTATTRALAVAASLTSYSKSGIASTVRLTLDEADGYLTDAETLRSGRTPAPRRTTAPPAPTRSAPAPAPSRRTPPTSAPTTSAPRSPRPAPQRPAPQRQVPQRPASPTRAGANRAVCARCGARLRLVGPMHLVHVEDLDSFYRKAFDPAMLATSTVYRYECATCHSVELFTTAG